MGNCLSGSLADIYLEFIIVSAIKNLKKKNIKIKLLTKYVDDIFIICAKNHINDILQTFNLFDNKLQFTLETESNNGIPYLDVKIFHNNGNITTDWYCKPSSSNRILNYLSNHPEKVKKNIAKSFIKRVLNLSSPIHHQNTIAKIKNILKLNNYPPNFTIKLLRQVKNEKNNIKIIVENSEEPTNYRCLPYIPNLSESLSRSIQKKSSYQIAYKTQKPARELYTKTKAKIGKLEKSNAVYEIKCECGSKYIGQSGRKIDTRIKEHKNYIT